DVSGNATFSGLTIEAGGENLKGKITFGTAVEFVVPPIFSKDTAGFALIKEGDRKVRVTFEEPYAMTPVVTTSMTFESTDNIDDVTTDDLFAKNLNSIVLEKDTTGFTILLNKNAPHNVRFSWIALGVKDAKVFESLGDGLEIVPPD